MPITSVAEYIATFPDDVQPILRRVRTVIRKAVPGAEEGIAYQIPTYKRHGCAVIYFAGWKQHYSLYPVSAALVAPFKAQVAGHPINKGTIRFPLSEPVPVALIARIAKLRDKQVAAEAKKAASKKKKKKKARARG